jgi:hypothetical protein
VYTVPSNVSQLGIKSGNAHFILAHRFSILLKSAEYAGKTTNQPLIIAKDGKHHHYAVGTTGTTSHRHSISTQADHNHYAVGTSGTTSHRHVIPNQGDHSHGITNGSVGNYNTSYVTAGGTNHAHTYSSWVAATSANNGGSHSHGGYTYPLI